MTKELDLPKIQVGGLPVGVLSRKGWAARMVAVCRQKKGREVPEIVISANGNVLAKCK